MSTLKELLNEPAPSKMLRRGRANNRAWDRRQTKRGRAGSKARARVAKSANRWYELRPSARMLRRAKAKARG